MGNEGTVPSFHCFKKGIHFPGRLWYDMLSKNKEANKMDFETVRDMIAEQLKVDPAEIKPESRLMEDLKADSANIMVMIMDMEDRFGITVEDDQIMKLKTVGDVAAYIAKVKG